MRRILIALVLIGVVGAGAFQASQAFFSDTETSSNNIFQAGVLDLLIDNTSYYNNVLSESTSWTLDDLPGHLFFNFLDIKPSDRGEDTISIHVNDNEAWSCMNMTLTKNDDNTCTEPESLDDLTCDDPDADLQDGELAQSVNFVFWVDDGDNVLEDNEDEKILTQGNTTTVMNGVTIPLADSTVNKFGGAVGDGLDPEQTYYIGKAWCFGTLGLAPLVQDNDTDAISPATTTGGITCDGSALNNATQTDLLNADIAFSAVQHRNNPGFRCDGATPTPTASASPLTSPSPSPSPTPIACIETYATTAHDPSQGTQKSGAAVLANRSVTSAMFGPPQTAGNPSDVGFPVGSFYSLGFKPALPEPEGGSVVVGFAAPFFANPSGPDLQVFEVTGGVYPDEKIRIEVGSTSTGPWTLAAASATRDATVELPVASAQFVRLTDVSDIALFPTDADAYDVDAVKAFCAHAQ